MRILYIILSSIFIIIIGILLINKLSYTDVIVKFDELEPFSGKMKVYYKGFEIGKTDKIYPDKNFENTYLNLRLNKKNLNLPSNVTAELKNYSGNAYISIIYPASPAIKRLGNGSIIQGKYQKNMDSIINETINGENVQNIVGNASSLIENANKTVQSLGKIFDEITLILKDIHPSIKTAAQNIEKTTVHLSNTADNLDNALKRTTTENSVNNIEEITENFKEITTQINKISIPSFNSVLCETQETVKNTKEITQGLNCTLNKHLGFMRMFFGRPVSKCENCR